MFNRFSLVVGISLLVFSQIVRGETALDSKLKEYVDARCLEFDQISADRKSVLDQLSQFITKEMAARREVKLTFICTHNSRRSHLSHLWAHAAAAHYGIPNVSTYSGGTEATAFNPRAVAALQRAGFTIEKSDSSSNPVYLVRLNVDAEPQKCFSKKYDTAPNPTENFGAIMVCSQADTSCPNVPGATKRLAVPYEDPKVADGRDDESKVYDERCAQIAREMMYVFSRVKK